MALVKSNGLTPSVVERDIEGSRDRLGDLLEELTRRRQGLMRGPHWIRGHLSTIALAGGAVIALGLSIFLGSRYRYRARRRRFFNRVRGLRAALGRMAAHPERVAGGKPPFAQKLLLAAGTSAMGVVAKRLAETAVQRFPRGEGRHEPERIERAGVEVVTHPTPAS